MVNILFFPVLMAEHQHVHHIGRQATSLIMLIGHEVASQREYAFTGNAGHWNTKILLS